MKLYIKTFGNFDIIYDGQSLIEEQSRQHRLYRLFQYFISYRNRRLLPESIIDDLFQDNQSADLKSVLRTQIFRLRKIIKNIIPEGGDDEDYICINFTNGYYVLKTGRNLILDIDEFEKLINEGDICLNSNLDEATDLYIKALDLYKGLYISENS